jgi:hypothetical protein
LKPLDVFAGVLEVEETGEGAGAAGWGRVYVCPMTPSEDERGAGDTATDGKCVFVVVDSCDAADWSEVSISEWLELAAEAAWCSMEDDADEENEDDSEEEDIAIAKPVVGSWVCCQ